MLFTSFSALLAVLHALPALAQEDQYPLAAVKQGIDPAEVVARKVEATGKWECSICVGVVYTDPKFGTKKCCDLGETFSTDPVHNKEGACCETPAFTYSFDPSTSKGQCCPKGQKFIGGSCIVPQPPQPLPDPQPRPDPTCTDKDCPQGYVCACDGHLGIKYGHCYTMTDVNGLPPNRDTGGTYQSGGDIGNLIFRVCKSTDSCTDSAGTPVPEKGSWYLEDQLGSRDTPGPGWFGQIGAAHMGISSKGSIQEAAHFTAEPFCFFGSCAHCLRLASGDLTGISASCPLGGNAEMAHLGRAKNPNNCKAYRFQEIKCLETVNPPPK